MLERKELANLPQMQLHLAVTARSSAATVSEFRHCLFSARYRQALERACPQIPGVLRAISDARLSSQLAFDPHLGRRVSNLP